MTSPIPGLIVLIGSGETLASSRKTHEAVAQQLPENPRLAILETPAGFEPNSDLVAGKIKTFLARRLQNYNPSIDVLPARKKGTPLSPDNPEIIAPLYQADEILLGPGSPTYAVRQLRDSLALDVITARHRLGATLFLASSATLAFSAYAMPVYEIYKVGDELHWQKGLDFLAPFNLPLVVIPHWNNTDGGAELDTSRCFVGEERFAQLRALLPPGLTIVGLDEHTSALIDFAEGCCQVMGLGGITVIRDGETRVFASGDSFRLDQFGAWRLPAPEEGIPTDVWQRALEAQVKRRQKSARRPDENALALLDRRTAAREVRDWPLADQLRAELAGLGWQVNDTHGGSELVPLDP